MNAAVSQLKATLSRFLARVKRGEELIITERRRPIAKIVPIGHDRSTLPAWLRELERVGLAKVGTGHLPSNFWGLPRPKDPRARARQALLEERAEGR